MENQDRADYRLPIYKAAPIKQMYHIGRQLQHSQARKAGINFKI
jgi:hypothetical protein